MLVPKCNYSNPVYRYGFQGQEKDNEIKGIGNSVNYKFRMHDPRVGRFFAVDPLAAKYPWYTPYQFSGNKVMQAVELEGLESSADVIQNIKDKETLNSEYRYSSQFAHIWTYSKNITYTPYIKISVTPSVGFQAGGNIGTVDLEGGFSVRNIGTYSISTSNITKIKEEKSNKEVHHYFSADIGLKKKLSLGGEIDVTCKEDEHPVDITDMIFGSYKQTDLRMSIGYKTKSNKHSNEKNIYKPSINAEAGTNFIGITIPFSAKLLWGIDIKLQAGIKQKNK